MKTKSSIVLVGIASFVYIFLEWLFFVTKPSVLSDVVFVEKVVILFQAFLALFFIGLLLNFSLKILIVIGSRLGFLKKDQNTVVYVVSIIFSSAAFLLVDNFTYTVFGFATFSLRGVERLIYLLLYGYFLWFFYKRLSAFVKNYYLQFERPFFALTVCLLLGAFSSVGVVKSPLKNSVLDVAVEGVRPSMNVLFLFADGLNASSMSLYGSGRQTTPYLDSIRSELLVFENHFTNSAKTTGSIGSLLSGKYPATTHVIFRPDVFTGPNSYEHFPGILKAYGYTSGDFSVRHYADPVDLNMQNGFDEANGRIVALEGSTLSALRNWYPRGVLFFSQICERITGRLLHSSGIKDMYNPFVMVTRPDVYDYESMDRSRVDDLKKFILGAKKPFFAHVHLLGTHGPRFFTEDEVFAEGAQVSDWSVDHYDDAVLQYDRYIEEIVDFLNDEGLLDNTLLVFNADHGFRWGISTPIPLVFRFPNQEYTGIRTYNTQRLDIPFSVLQYLGVEPPEWMEGDSLLVKKNDDSQPIYVVNRMPSSKVNGWSQVVSPLPPFYTLGIVSAIYCDTVFHLNLSVKNNLVIEKIKGFSGICETGSHPDANAVYYDLLMHLKDRGYDTTSLE